MSQFDQQMFASGRKPGKNAGGENDPLNNFRTSTVKAGKGLPTGSADMITDLVFPQGNNYLADPVGWITDYLGEFIWSKQKEIAESVVENRYTFVPACHGPGKTRITSRIIGWWVDMHREDGLVIWTANKWAQVTGVMGRELRNLVSQHDLPGRLTLDQQWYIQKMDKKGKPQDILIGVGRKPADHDEHGFQGYHAKKLLIVVDEADGIELSMWKAIRSLMTSPDARCLVLGNPDNPTSEFAEMVDLPPKSSKIIKISAYDTPNFTGEYIPEELKSVLVTEEWVEDQIDRYGKDSPIVQSKVFAEFPKSHQQAIYPLELIKSAMTEDKPDQPASMLAVDVARGGQDSTVAFSLHGKIPHEVFSLPQNDTGMVVGRIVNWWRNNPRAAVIVDANGVGAGVYDGCREQGVPVIGFVGSGSPRDKTAYLNMRAESYFHTQLALKRDQLKLPKHMTQLHRQMSQSLFEYSSKGQLKVMSKEDMARLGIKSPNELDALTMLAYASRLGRFGLNIESDGLDDDGFIMSSGYAT